MVPPHLEAMVSLVALSLLDNRDFLFHLATQANLTLFTHIINPQISKIFVRNAFNEVLCIPCHHKLGHLVDIAYDNCVLTDT